MGCDGRYSQIAFFIDSLLPALYNVCMTSNRPIGFLLPSLFAIAVFCVVSLQCASTRQLAPSEISAIRCEYIFRNTEKEDADRLERLIERYRMEDFNVFVDVGDDSIYCEFTVESLNDIHRMHNDIRALPQLRKVRDGATVSDANRQIVFEEYDPVLRMEYRTVRLEGGLTMTVKFKISPGSKLYYAAEGEYEEEVPEIHIDRFGNVEFPVTVKEGQRYIYGRTVLGGVTKCVRIYIFTGETDEIPLDEYVRRVMVRLNP